jgi:hypothetical protein
MAPPGQERCAVYRKRLEVVVRRRWGRHALRERLDEPDACGVRAEAHDRPSGSPPA